MKNLFLFLAFGVSLNSFSQSKDTVVYRMVSNDYDAGFVNVNIDPLDILLSRARMSFNGQVGFSLYKNGFYLNMSGNIYYLDRLAETQLTDVHGSSVYQDQASRDISVLAGYYFTWRENKEQMFTLKTTSGGYNTVIHHVAKLKVDSKKFFGIEAGIKNGFAQMAYDYEDKEIPVQSVNYYNTSEQIPINSNFTTYMQYTWLQIGGSYGKIVNAEAEFIGYGKRKVKHFTRYYAHLYVPLSTKFEDIYYDQQTNTSSPITYRCVLTDVPVSKLGFKLGYEYTPIDRRLGFGAGIGALPGFKGNGNYFADIKISINIGKMLPSK